MSARGEEGGGSEEASGSQEQPGPAEPPKRGPGRPRKPQQEPTGEPVPKRPRGRPKGSKNKGPSKAAQKKAETTGEKRPRGRPRKWKLGLVRWSDVFYREMSAFVLEENMTRLTVSSRNAIWVTWNYDCSPPPNSRKGTWRGFGLHYEDIALSVAADCCWTLWTGLIKKIPFIALFFWANAQSVHPAQVLRWTRSAVPSGRALLLAGWGRLEGGIFVLKQLALISCAQQFPFHTANWLVSTEFYAFGSLPSKPDYSG
ncbi:hypothetical protein SRHO_G00003090 [Serrasalmus rhombeus]